MANKMMECRQMKLMCACHNVFNSLWMDQIIFYVTFSFIIVMSRKTGLFVVSGFFDKRLAYLSFQEKKIEFTN